MEKPAICIVTVNFVPDNQAVSIRMTYLAEALIREGYPTTILTSKRSKEVKYFNVKVNLVSPGTNRDGVMLRLIKEMMFAVETFIRILFGKNQFYIITSPPFILALLASMACVLKRSKFILDVRDEYPEVFFSEKLISRDGIIGKVLISLEEWMYKNAFLITTVTNRIVIKIRNKVKEKRKIWLLRNGYAEGIEPVTVARSPLFNIMFHGNMGKFQNPKIILDLAQRCCANNKNIRFTIFGWGNNLESLQNQKIPNLDFKGEISHQEIKNIIPTMQLGFSFQKDGEIPKNSFPSKVYEFIGAGVPTLITPISEAGDFVEQNEVGFQFNSDDIESIYLKLVSLSENPSELEKLRKNAIAVREKLSRKYLSEDFVKKLSEELSIHNTTK